MRVARLAPAAEAPPIVAVDGYHLLSLLREFHDQERRARRLGAYLAARDVREEFYAVAQFVRKERV